jgi:hypothetical protein
MVILDKFQRLEGSVGEPKHIKCCGVESYIPQPKPEKIGERDVWYDWPRAYDLDLSDDQRAFCVFRSAFTATKYMFDPEASAKYGTERRPLIEIP